MATIALYANQMNQMPGLIKDVTKSVTDYKSELSALKAKTLTINKSVCDLEDVIRSIQTSTQTQEQKSTSLDTFNNNCEDFIAEVVRIDGDAADRINTRKKEFYAQYYYLKPEYEKTWLEVIKDWFTAVREWCRQKWELQTEERAVRCVRMHKEAVVLLTVGVLGQKQVKEGEMPRYLKEFLKQLRTNPDRIIMNAEQIKKYEELKRWPDWWGKEGGSDTVDKLPEDGSGGREKPDTPLYNYTEQMVNNITTLDPKFDKEVEEFKEAYMRNKSVYEEISKKAGVPPELIGIIHYRESTSDFINGNFNVYLHNGEALGAKTTLNPVGKDFNNFVDAAVDAIHDKQNYVEKYNLTSDSKDEVAIMVFAEVYNGLGYYNNGHVSPYLYSGTNIYTSGKYVEEFINGKPVGVYNPQIVDKQIGAYLLLESLK